MFYAAGTPKYYSLPHARGGEPGVLYMNDNLQFVCPTHVGVNRPRGLFRRRIRWVCPTHVGVNRAKPTSRQSSKRSAPRTWG